MYTKEKKIGEGTYATIYKAYSKNNELVAIKKIKKTKNSMGFDISAIREIKSLKKIKNKYVINLKDIYIKNDNIHLVLEYLETDLEQLIRNKSIIFLPSDIKSYMIMILTGVYSLHEKFIIHRDLKPNNILINKNNIIKIADFGLSRSIGRNMTSQAVTRWYRAPELLLGSRIYGMSVDMWSIGCIFAELMLRVPLFAGESDLEQLNLIFKVFGTPKEEEYKSIKELSGYIKFNEKDAIKLEELFSAASEETLEMMKKFFIFDPNKRIDVYSALMDKYFKNEPKATLPKDLPR
ncbi:cyclin-dependent kinase [Vairimorpha necatrix]|uniref:[RNA-polymerase]-subunit kinase n=1 Tax=Vairimorpha necatrix TaxID=6039 RepID=A0AAX4JFH8_9MICR